jgi:uncharacterized protein (DUF4415 family)
MIRFYRKRRGEDDSPLWIFRGCRIGEVFLQERFVLAELYVQYYTYMQMKRRTRVTKAGAAKARRATRRRTISLMASVEEPKNAHAMIEQFQRMYKARKKAVTLRLDADVLAWFKREGRGYQTRINRVLRGVMWEEERKSWK